MALIGANGAGKSSILRAITGLRKIRSGEIRFRGERIDGLAPDEIVKMGIAMVPEGRRVFPLHVGEGQSADGRLHPHRQGRGRAHHSRRCWRASRGSRSATPGGRHDERRRAADAGHRPRPDGQPRCCCSTSPRSASPRSSCRTSPARSSPSIATRRSACCWSSRIRAWRSRSRTRLCAYHRHRRAVRAFGRASR